MATNVPAGPSLGDGRPIPGRHIPDTPGEPRGLHQDGVSAGPSLAPWAVVAIWAVLLGILVSISAAMGNNLVVLEISGGAALLVLVIAGAVWLHQRLRPYRGTYSLPVRIGGVFLLAVTVETAWLSLAFGQYMLYLAVVPLTGAVLLETAARRYAREQARNARRRHDAVRRQPRWHR